MTPDLTHLPPAMHVAALLVHVMDSLSAAVPPPLALTTDGTKVLLLDGQRLRSSSSVDVPDETPDVATLLREAALDILDEVQDLVMSATAGVWPDGPSPHPAATWTEQGALRLGYYPSGDSAQAAVLAVADYAPPTGGPRVAG